MQRQHWAAYILLVCWPRNLSRRLTPSFVDVGFDLGSRPCGELHFPFNLLLQQSKSVQLN